MPQSSQNEQNTLALVRKKRQAAAVKILEAAQKWNQQLDQDQLAQNKFRILLIGDSENTDAYQPSLDGSNLINGCLGPQALAQNTIQNFLGIDTATEFDALLTRAKSKKINTDKKISKDLVAFILKQAAITQANTFFFCHHEVSTLLEQKDTETDNTYLEHLRQQLRAQHPKTIFHFYHYDAEYSEKNATYTGDLGEHHQAEEVLDGDAKEQQARQRDIELTQSFFRSASIPVSNHSVTSDTTRARASTLLHRPRIRFASLSEQDRKQLTNLLSYLKLPSDEKNSKLDPAFYQVEQEERPQFNFCTFTLTDFDEKKLTEDEKKEICDALNSALPFIKNFKPSQSLFDLMHAVGVKNYSKMDLSGLSLFEKEFTGCDFSGAKLEKCKMINATFSNCMFKGAVLNDSDASNAVFDNTPLKEAAIKTITVNSRSLFNKSVLPEKIQFAFLRDLDGTFKLTQSLFDTLYENKHTDFSNMDLSGLNLSYRKLQYCKFVGSNLTGCNLQRSNCDGCDFTRATLTDADLRNTALTNTVMRGATVENILINISTNLQNCDACNTKNESVFQEKTPVRFEKPQVATQKKPRAKNPEKKDPRIIRTTIGDLYKHYQKEKKKTSLIIRFLNGIRDILQGRRKLFSDEPQISSRLFRAFREASAEDLCQTSDAPKQKLFARITP